MAQDEVIGFADGEFPGLDTARVAAWLGEHTPVAPPVEFGLIAAGGSNLTYRITDAAGDMWVLRRPPTGELLQSAHDVAREHRILAGLRATAVPVPEVVGLCTDHEVTGASFFVMRYVEGHILRTRDMGAALGEAGARTAAVNFFEALATIHTASPEAAGLEGLSRPGGYIERQLRRWHQQYLQTAGDDASPVEAALHDRLAASIPPDVAPGASHLVHGDFHIDNAVFDADLSVKAIFDWELSTLGNPIADLAWAMLFWAEPGDSNAFLQDPPSQAPGFLTRAEAIEVYGRASGYDVDAMPYFEAFSKWKMACLLSGTLHRARRGTGGGLQVKTGSNLESQLQRILALFDEADGLI